jgi:hypothetical protein
MSQMLIGTRKLILYKYYGYRNIDNKHNQKPGIHLFTALVMARNVCPSLNRHTR